MRHHVVFLERDSIRLPMHRPGFEHTYEEYASTAPDEVVARLQRASVAIINKIVLDRRVLAELPRLRMIALTATGYDCIDVAACREHGIAVANVRGYAVHTVPEHVFMLVLALRRNLLGYRQEIEHGAWQRSEQFCLSTYPISELSGSVMGIVGAGAIGRATAAIARGFGMRVQFALHASRSDRSRAPEAGFVPFDRLLAESDVLTLHCPLTPATRHLIGIDELRRMKRSALLVNTARGGLVDEAALVRALEEGLIAGAGFDVLSEEPPAGGNPLLALRRPDFILTPHMAWASDEAMRTLAWQVVDNIEAWAAGTPRNLVT